MIDSSIVMFSDINVEQIVSYWLGVNIDFVNSYLGMIFSKIGFNQKDNIYVFGYTKDSHLLFMVNGVENHSILMSSKKRDDGYNPVVYYDNDNTLDGYECRIDKYGRFDIDFIRVKYNDMEVDRLIKDDLEYEDISISKDGYVIEFRISKVGNGLFNKENIVNYLNELSLPLSIFDIYKGICCVSLLNNIECYSLVDLRLINMDNGIEEMIVLSDGKLVNLLVNNNGKIVSCDNNGNYTYETDKVAVDFSVIINNGIIDFNSRVRCKADVEDYSIDLASHDINVAKKEITNVKRLVKRMF